MAKETTQQKAERLLLERKVTVRFAQDGNVHAAVEGSEKYPYRVIYLMEQDWSCSCVATVRCSHILAVMMVAGLRREGNYSPCNDALTTTKEDAPPF